MSAYQEIQALIKARSDRLKEERAKLTRMLPEIFKLTDDYEALIADNETAAADKVLEKIKNLKQEQEEQRDKAKTQQDMRFKITPNISKLAAQVIEESNADIEELEKPKEQLLQELQHLRDETVKVCENLYSLQYRQMKARETAQMITNTNPRDSDFPDLLGKVLSVNVVQLRDLPLCDENYIIQKIPNSIYRPRTGFPSHILSRTDAE